MSEHFKHLPGRPFTRAERNRVTCLTGGLTQRHHALIRAAAEGMGYNAACIPTPTLADYHTGREYGNPGMCNPAYFTSGALINYLRRLRDDQGIPAPRILEDYVFVTAGSCGPCRFGTYESEYRLALRHSGFDGFRVLLFQQKGGLHQSGDGAGLEVDARFAVMLVLSLMLGDLFNDLAFQIRPYEIVPGQTDRVFAKVLGRLCDALRVGQSRAARPGFPARVLARLLPRVHPGALTTIVDAVLGQDYINAVAECGRMIDQEIEVDYTRPKAVCKITGEAWAQLTEGDGNFRMFEFLESHGAEIHAEPMMTWGEYLLAGALARLDESRNLAPWEDPPAKPGLTARLRGLRTYCGQRYKLRLAAALIHRSYGRLRGALNGLPHPLPNQEELRWLAQPFFNSRITGGEGHLEVAKTIYYSVNGLCHMVISLKPFGCLPSTQSDGVQPAVIAHYARLGKEILFLPVETAGEGGLHAHSRVQMALTDAQARCAHEFEVCLEESGYPLEVIRRYVFDHPEFRRPLQNVRRRKGIAGRASNFVLHVAACMRKDPDGVQAATRSGTGDTMISEVQERTFA